MKKIIGLLIIAVLLTACSQNEKEPVKKDHTLSINQSNFLWNSEYLVHFLQLQEKDGELDALLTITELNKETFNFEDHTIILVGKRIGNKFSLHTEQGMFSMNISGKIDSNKIIINDEDGEKIYTKISEKIYDSALSKVKNNYEEEIKKYAIETAKKYYETNNYAFKEDAKYKTKDRKGKFIEVEICEPNKNTCEFENLLKINISNNEIQPQIRYEEQLQSEEGFYLLALEEAKKYYDKKYGHLNENIEFTVSNMEVLEDVYVYIDAFDASKGEDNVKYRFKVKAFTNNDVTEVPKEALAY